MADSIIDRHEFAPFPKMPRLRRECIITEKIDGTNACVKITENGLLFAGSRSRWITPADDNFGFAKWVLEHRDELMQLGPGTHFGEWWGSGIQRGYGLPKGEKRFSLFNTIRWCLASDEPQLIPSADPRIEKYQERLPKCCGLVPVLSRGLFNTVLVDLCLRDLMECGSAASPGFMKPEGVVCYHVAGNFGFKATIEKDEEPKGLRA